MSVPANTSSLHPSPVSTARPQSHRAAGRVEEFGDLLASAQQSFGKWVAVASTTLPTTSTLRAPTADDAHGERLDDMRRDERARAARGRRGQPVDANGRTLTDRQMRLDDMKRDAANTTARSSGGRAGSSPSPDRGPGERHSVVGGGGRAPADVATGTLTIPEGQRPTLAQGSDPSAKPSLVMTNRALDATHTADPRIDQALLASRAGQASGSLGGTPTVFQGTRGRAQPGAATPGPSWSALSAVRTSGNSAEGARIVSSAPTGAAASMSAEGSSSTARTRLNPDASTGKGGPSPGSAAAKPPTDGESMGRVAFERLVGTLRLHTGARDSTAVIRLDPPELGQVRIDMRVADGRVSLDVQTQTFAAHDLLRSRVADLRQTLEQQGLTVERLELTLPVDQADRSESADQPTAKEDAPSDGSGAAPQGETPHRRGAQGETAGGPGADAALVAPLMGNASPEEDGKSNEVTVWDARLDIRI